MRLPKTSHRPSGTVREISLGKGDYIAGGACSVPFLDLDSARRRRPLVFGEVTDDLSNYPALAADMFSGRQTDPEEWAVMWKEIGADGIWLDQKGDDPDLARRIAERTRLPMAVTADDRILDACSDTEDTVMILMPRSGHTLYRRGHVSAIRGDDADSTSGLCEAADGCVVIYLGSASLRDGIGREVDLAEEIRSRALSGESSLAHPTMAYTGGCWAGGFSDHREASMWEASTALALMLAGTDILIMRGPGAADMARVYGEELADL